MTVRSLATAAALATFAFACVARADPIDTILANAMKGTSVPALAALEMRDGKVETEGVRGLRRNDRPDAARVGDPWLIGSDAKPMTAALVARLVDRGLLSWTTPLDKMLPELAGSMRPEFRSATLLQLLSHHAGLAHDTTDMAFFETFFHDTRTLPAQRLAYIAHALQEAPESTPGTQFSYSNTGFIVAAVIAERAGGAPYEALIKREVFQPLGMGEVEFGPTHEGQPQGHVKGAPAKLEDANPLMFAPAGNMAMSLRDWAAFCLDQMAGAQGKGQLLSAAAYGLMQTPQPGGGSAGVGWGIQPSLGGHAGPVLMHAGSDGTGFALVALFPQRRFGVLTVANAAEDMGGDVATKAAMIALMASLP